MTEDFINELRQPTDDDIKEFHQSVESPFGSGFGKPNSLDSDGFSEEETRAIEYAQMDAAASSQVSRAVYAGVPMSQAVRDGAVKEENGVYSFGNCKVSAEKSLIVAFDNRGDQLPPNEVGGLFLSSVVERLKADSLPKDSVL